MHVARKWQLKPRALAEALPGQPTSLTPLLRGMLPLPEDFMADPANFFRIDLLPPEIADEFLDALLGNNAALDPAQAYAH